MTDHYADINYPGNLEHVINWDRVGPGDTVHLRAGTYSGDFTCTLDGTAELPITIRPYQEIGQPPERAIIDGSFVANCSYVDLIDLEVIGSNWGETRDSIPTGESPAVGGMTLSGTGGHHIRAIGCIIHDTSGNASWNANVGGGYYECLIYNCGWLSPDRGHGHAIYTQGGQPTQVHQNNIMWGQYGWGLHGYSQTEDRLDYIEFRNNISFRNGGRQMTMGGAGGIRPHAGVVIDSNVFLEGDPYLLGTDVILTNNYSPNGFEIDPNSENITQSGNTFEAPASGTNIFVYPRTFKAGWAHVAIFNWDLADSVDVDLTAVTGLGVGDTYKLRSATNYFDEIVTGTLAANRIVTVDMRAISHTIVARVGSTAVATTFPGFGCFVIEKA